MAKILRIYQLEDGYCYNCDSLFLWDFALLYVKEKSKILDIGSGSGILSLLLSRDRLANGIALEKDALMSKICSKNIALNHANFDVENIDFKDYKSDIKFDVIISNPPFYVSSNLQGQNERKNLARNSANLPLDIFLTHAKRLIKPNGDLIFCYDSKLSDNVLYHLINIGFNPLHIRFVHPSIHKDATLILVHAKIHSKSHLQILPPIYSHNPTPKSSVDYTEMTEKIFKNANTFSIKINSKNVDL